jgi:4-amino-4-deoxy-L-arabinose transferase-like glycosyltransferase
MAKVIETEAESRPLADTLKRYELQILAASIIVGFLLFSWGVGKNTPAFYLDEASIAYNAYTISTTGQDEFGVSWPLYFRAFGEYKNPVYLYLLAFIYKFAGPSTLIAKYLSVIVGFLAVLILGYLAYRITRNLLITALTICCGILTPNILEVSRLVFEVAMFPLSILTFLLLLYWTQKRERWGFLSSIALALALAFITYTYSTGRLLAPLLAFGLFLFANRRNWTDIAQTVLNYVITLIPLLIFVERNPGALTGRFYAISYIQPETSYGTAFREFVGYYLTNLSPKCWLIVGDDNIRHHLVAASGSMLIAPFVLGVAGIALVLANQRHDRWWRYCLFGLIVSIVPAALTVDQCHSLRLIAFPVFLLLFTIPALAWLLEWNRSEQLKKALLGVFMAGLILQSIFFFSRFYTEGPERGYAFDDGYSELLLKAREFGSDKIYLLDGPYYPGYILGYWYGTLQGIERDRLVHVEDRSQLMPGSVVISSEEQCETCEIVMEREPYMLYRTR